MPRLWALTSFSGGPPPGDPHGATNRKIVLGSRQTDGPDVVRVGDGTGELHQGDVVVKCEWVVVRVGYDLLQGPLLHGGSNVPLDVKPELSFPFVGLRQPEENKIATFVLN